MKYSSVGFSELEIPLERNLVIYLTECKHRCKNCHTPYAQEIYGDELIDYFTDIVIAYKNMITCVVFMGEGNETEKEHMEFDYYNNYIHSLGIKTALYSGRNCEIEDWMKQFDYIKIGSYDEKYGALTERTTNQKLYKKINDNYKDITNIFWDKNIFKYKE